MSLVVNTNVGALQAYNALSHNQAMQQSAMEKLSTGLRINKAADDAAGLAISQGLTSQINGMGVAVRNAQDGINLAQIADGALGTSQSILQRMRDLAVQAANDTNDSGARSDIQAEMDKLATTLDNIASGTKFGTKTLLDGSLTATSALNFQVGAGTSATDSVSLSLSAATSNGLGASGLSATTVSGAKAAIDKIDAAIQAVSTQRANIGAFQNQMNYTITNLQSTIQNVSASRSNITDADLATEVTTMTQAQILAQASTSMLSQANSAPQAVLKLLQ